MSVAIKTTRGTFVVDLYLRCAPMLGFNFLKLCKLGWFDNSLFFEIVENFMVKVGHLNHIDGLTIYGLLQDDPNITIPDEITHKLTHSKAGLLSTCNKGKNMNTSAFFITLGYDLSRFNDIRSIFGEVSENYELVEKISKEYVDSNNRPFRNIRLTKTIVLYDPFGDPEGFDDLKMIFRPFDKVKELDRLEDDQELSNISAEEHQKAMDALKATKNAEILEMLGDIPGIESKPPETSLFVCKLHPKTTEDGLRIVFSRFGQVDRVDLIKDKKTNESLCYAFVDFVKPIEAENAFLKMQNAIIDNRRILVDFCQSLKGPKASSK